MEGSGLVDVLEVAIVTEITASLVATHRWAFAADAVAFRGETYESGVLLDVDPAGDAMTGPTGPVALTFHPPAAVDWRRDPGPLVTVVRWLARNRGSTEWTEVHAVRGRFSGLRPAEDGRFTVEIERLRGGFGDVTPRRWSNEDQQAAYPGDRGLEFLPRLADQGISVPWPPEQGYGEQIGPSVARVTGPPSQASDSPGRVEVAGGAGSVERPNPVRVTLFDNDQPLSEIVWTWESRGSSLDLAPEEITGAGSRGADQASYPARARDVGKQVRASAAYTDANGPNKAAVSAWVSVMAETTTGPGPTS